MTTKGLERIPIPRDKNDDYTRDAAAVRRAFAEERTGTVLEHVAQYSFDPSLLLETLKISLEWHRFLSGLQVLSELPGSMREATSTSPWRRPKAP
jgi:hypothetical protein